MYDGYLSVIRNDSRIFRESKQMATNNNGNGSHGSYNRQQEPVLLRNCQSVSDRDDDDGDDPTEDLNEAARRGRHKGLVCSFRHCNKFARLTNTGLRKFCVQHMREVGLVPKTYLSYKRLAQHRARDDQPREQLQRHVKVLQVQEPVSEPAREQTRTKSSGARSPSSESAHRLGGAAARVWADNAGAAVDTKGAVGINTKAAAAAASRAVDGRASGAAYLAITYPGLAGGGSSTAASRNGGFLHHSTKSISPAKAQGAGAYAVVAGLSNYTQKGLQQQELRQLSAGGPTQSVKILPSEPAESSGNRLAAASVMQASSDDIVSAAGGLVVGWESSPGQLDRKGESARVSAEAAPAANSNQPAAVGGAAEFNELTQNDRDLLGIGFGGGVLPVDLAAAVAESPLRSTHPLTAGFSNSLQAQLVAQYGLAAERPEVIHFAPASAPVRTAEQLTLKKRAFVGPPAAATRNPQQELMHVAMAAAQLAAQRTPAAASASEAHQSKTTRSAGGGSLLLVQEPNGALSPNGPKRLRGGARADTVRAEAGPLLQGSDALLAPSLPTTAVHAKKTIISCGSLPRRHGASPSERQWASAASQVATVAKNATAAAAVTLQMVPRLYRPEESPLLLAAETPRKEMGMRLGNSKTLASGAEEDVRPTGAAVAVAEGIATKTSGLLPLLVDSLAAAPLALTPAATTVTAGAAETAAATPPPVIDLSMAQMSAVVHLLRSVGQLGSSTTTLPAVVRQAEDPLPALLPSALPLLGTVRVLFQNSDGSIIHGPLVELPPADYEPPL